MCVCVYIKRGNSQGCSCVHRCYPTWRQWTLPRGRFWRIRPKSKSAGTAQYIQISLHFLLYRRQQWRRFNKPRPCHKFGNGDCHHDGPVAPPVFLFFLQQPFWMKSSRVPETESNQMDKKSLTFNFQNTTRRLEIPCTPVAPGTAIQQNDHWGKNKKYSTFLTN